jgi:hypothetical protein
MTKIVTVHQPNYLPWIGLFSKIKQSDCLIIGDTYFLGGQSTLNRNKIRTKNGWNYLTIPIGHKNKNTRICDITMPIENSWQKFHWKMIHDNYTRSPFFNQHRGFFERLYKNNYSYIWQINEEIIAYLLDCFNIETEVVKASDINIDPSLEKTDLMIALLKSVGAHTYLSGPSGRKYLEVEKFAQNGINLKYFKFEHPTYKQRYPGFEPCMSAIDLLFNMGSESSKLIKISGSVEDPLILSPA